MCLIFLLFFSFSFSNFFCCSMHIACGVFNKTHRNVQEKKKNVFYTEEKFMLRKKNKLRVGCIHIMAFLKDYFAVFFFLFLVGEVRYIHFFFFSTEFQQFSSLFIATPYIRCVYENKRPD